MPPNRCGAEVTPGHHDTVAGMQDLFEMADGLPALDFRKERESRATLLQECSHLFHIPRAAHKRQG